MSGICLLTVNIVGPERGQMPPCALVIQLMSQEIKIFSPNSLSLLQELFRGTVAWQDLSVPLQPPAPVL